MVVARSCEGREASRCVAPQRRRGALTWQAPVAVRETAPKPNVRQYDAGVASSVLVAYAYDATLMTMQTPGEGDVDATGGVGGS